MIRTVAVVRNINQSTYETSLPIIFRGTTGESPKWIFLCPYYVTRTPHDSKHLHGWRGRKHRAAHHPVDNPTGLCARYRARQRDMVRQDLYRMNRIPLGKLVHTHGLGGELLTLGETMSKRMLTIEKEKPINKYNG